MKCYLTNWMKIKAADVVPMFVSEFKLIKLYPQVRT